MNKIDQPQLLTKVEVEEEYHLGRLWFRNSQGTIVYEVGMTEGGLLIMSTGQLLTKEEVGERQTTK